MFICAVALSEFLEAAQQMELGSSKHIFILHNIKNTNVLFVYKKFLHILESAVYSLGKCNVRKKQCHTLKHAGLFL